MDTLTNLGSVKTKLSLFEAITSVGPESYPPAPLEYLRFIENRNSEAWQKKGREKQDQEIAEWYQQPFIKDYVERLNKVQLQNRGNLLWLVEYRDRHLNPGDVTEAAKIREKIEEFVRFMGDQSQIHHSLRLNFRLLKVEHVPVPAQKGLDWDA